MADDDEDTFAKAVRGVRRLTTTAPRPAPPKPAAVARFTRAEAAAVLDEAMTLPTDPAILETGDELGFLRDGLRPDLLRRLKRGQYAVAAEVDLHGLGREAARAALREFIVESTAHGLRCVRVIHGKGLRSGPRGPIIKHVVNHWLRKMQEVAAFATARPVDGGGGAVYVLLARRAPGTRSR